MGIEPAFPRQTLARHREKIRWRIEKILDRCKYNKRLNSRTNRENFSCPTNGENCFKMSIRFTRILSALFGTSFLWPRRIAKIYNSNWTVLLAHYCLNLTIGRWVKTITANQKEISELQEALDDKERLRAFSTLSFTVE